MVGLLGCGVIVIHRPKRSNPRCDGNATPTCTSTGSIDGAVATHVASRAASPHQTPRSTLVKRVVCRVQAQNRTKYAKLHPTRIQFRILHTKHVAANVMTPPAITDIGSRCCKVRLERQRFPVDPCIAGKSQSDNGDCPIHPSAKNKRSRCAVTRQIVMVQVIEPPERIEAGQTAKLALLPVDPPEIDTMRFLWMMQSSKYALANCGSARSNAIVSPVAGSRPSRSAICVYMASYGRTPSAGCKLSAVRKPRSCKAARNAGGSETNHDSTYSQSNRYMGRLRSNANPCQRCRH